MKKPKAKQGKLPEVITADNIKLIRIDQITVPEYHLRDKMDEDEMNALILDIKEHGVINPIIVREERDKFYLVEGYRRIIATKSAGYDIIACRIVDASEQESMELSFNLNDKREDNNPIEIARFFKKYIEKFKATQKELMRAFSLSQAAVSNYLRLLDLPEPVQYYIQTRALNTTHGLLLLKLKDPNKIVRTAENAVRENWTQEGLEASVDSQVKTEGWKQVSDEVSKVTGLNPDTITVNTKLLPCRLCRGIWPEDMLNPYISQVCASCITEAEHYLQNRYSQVVRSTVYAPKDEEASTA